MNRRDRRIAERQFHGDLRANGCTCTPRFEQIPRSQVVAAGAVDGRMVRHQRGCRLGDRMLIANAAGLLPALYASGPTPRCRR